MTGVTNKLADKDDIGGMIRYYDNGWRFAKLIKLGRKWARIQHPVSGLRWIEVGQVEHLDIDTH